MNFKSYFLIAIAILFLVNVTVIARNAYADGLTQENLPPASFGDRQAALFIKISPPILTKETAKDTSLELKLFDANNGQTIQHVSYFVEAWHDDKLVLRNHFHAHKGDLILDIRPTDVDVNDVVVYGDQVPQLPNTWTGFNDKVEVHAPVLLKAGLYHFKITITGIDYDQNIFMESDYKSFEAWLSVGDISQQTIKYNGNSYDTTIVSYYDKIQNFKFDDSKKQISFSMPFNWDTDRIQGQQIFVHQEVRIPNSFKDFTGTTDFDGKVNGIPALGRKLILDPYSIENTTILHFLINKQDIIEIAKTVSPDSKTMDFTLAPATAVEKKRFVANLEGGATAEVTYDATYGAGDTIPLKFSFFDKDGNILKYVRYGYSIEDSKGNVLVTDIGSDPQKIGIFTVEGIDVQGFKFASQGDYKVSLAIISTGLDEVKTWAGQGSATVTVGKSGQSSSSSTTTNPSTSKIPTWIKNNAKWWSDGTITDSDFVQGIQYLIKQGIMKVPPTETTSGTTSTVIPSWIKNNAKWWSDGTIGDSDFVQGIQYLIKQGIMKV